MKKITAILFLFSMLFSSQCLAGFWSSVFGGVVANTITGSGGRASSSNPAKQRTPEAKIQYALYGLGYYAGKFDGNLNTLDSRKSIEAFQNNYKLKASGVLAEDDKQQLLFVNELYATLLDEKTAKKKRNEIFDEVEKVKRLIGEKK